MRGGAARSLLELLSSLSHSQLIPIVVVPQRGEFSAECEKLGITCRFVPSVWWVAADSMDQWLYGMNRLPTAVAEVRKIIRQERIDVVHSNSSVNPVGAMAAAMEGIPHVWHIREFLSDSSLTLSSYPLDFRIVKDLVRILSCKVIAISEALAADHRVGVSDEKVEVVRDGIDASQFREIARSNSKVILSIGATTVDKGLDDLVEAASILRKRGIAAKFIVLGRVEPPDYFKQVSEKIKELGLSGCFRLEGFCSDIRPYLASAELFCLPSRAEGMSRTVLEAMAAGLPVVATDCGGPGEIVSDGQTGMLCPPNDPNALSNALSKVIEDRVLADSMSVNARETVRERFASEDAVNRISRIIKNASETPCLRSEASTLQLFLYYLEQAGPRVLLGKKWKLLKPLV